VLTAAVAATGQRPGFSWYHAMQLKPAKQQACAQASTSTG
jgi:hypothetical protein